MQNNLRAPLKLVVADSGVGGINLLNKLFYSVTANYVYFDDSANFPYGDKTPARLAEIGSKIVSSFPDADAIIFACNTLTVNCLGFLQARTKTRLFGCTPPINQAAMFTATKFAVLATPSTLSAMKTKLPYSAIACPCAELAEMVEREASEKEILDYLDEKLSRYSFDSIVLGCTHYSSLKTYIYRLYPAVKIFDSVDGAAGRLKKTFRSRRSPQMQSTVTFLGSGEGVEEKYSKIMRQFNEYS